MESVASVGAYANAGSAATQSTTNTTAPAPAPVAAAAPAAAAATTLNTTAAAAAEARRRANATKAVNKRWAAWKAEKRARELATNAPVRDDDDEAAGLSYTAWLAAKRESETAGLSQEAQLKRAVARRRNINQAAVRRVLTRMNTYVRVLLPWAASHLASPCHVVTRRVTCL